MKYPQLIQIVDLSIYQRKFDIDTDMNEHKSLNKLYPLENIYFPSHVCKTYVNG